MIVSCFYDMYIFGYADLINVNVVNCHTCRVLVKADGDWSFSFTSIQSTR